MEKLKIKDTLLHHWYQQLGYLVLVVFLFLFAHYESEADFLSLFENGDQLVEFLGRMMRPDFSYLSKCIAPLVSTLNMSVVGTFLGIVVALPISFCATDFVVKNKIITSFCKGFLALIRTIPTLLLAAILVAMIGIGEITGVLTIAIFTLGMVSQLFYEAIETIDLNPIESFTAVGANKLQIILYAIMPQISSNIVSYSFYAFEVNVRASSVLGLVGAGGIGLLLKSNLDFLRFDRVSLIVLLIFIVVVIVDTLSFQIRKRLS